MRKIMFHLKFSGSHANKVTPNSNLPTLKHTADHEIDNEDELTVFKGRKTDAKVSLLCYLSNYCKLYNV